MTVRGAAEIGAGLAAARAARPIRPGERIHVVGVQGAGASAAALLASWAGADVDGCDPGGPSQYTPGLDAAGVAVAGEHDPAHLRGDRPPERLAVTKALTAIDPDNAELAAARTAGVPVEPWQQVVADAAAGRVLIAVAGTHGKSTTSGWLVHALVGAGGDPGAFVGALLPAAITGVGIPATARRGSGVEFVVEADEYAGNFDPYRPDVIVLTSAEWDHPDVFAGRRGGDRGVRGMDPARRRGTATGPTCRWCWWRTRRDAGSSRRWSGGWTTGPGWWSAPRWTPSPRRSSSPGTSSRQTRTAPSCGSRLAGRGGARRAPDDRGPPQRRQRPGRDGACLAAGYPPEAVLPAVASFTGVGRRLERKGESHGVVVYDDYGHHPTAIRETLAAVRQREPGRRIWAVYEPLTYHRTAALLGAFADVLAAADGVVIADIWAGRDPDTTIASAAGLAAAVAEGAPGKTAVAPGSVEETARWLAGAVRPGDAVLVMGGGRSYRIGELLLEHLEAG